MSSRICAALIAQQVSAPRRNTRRAPVRAAECTRRTPRFKRSTD